MEPARRRVSSVLLALGAAGAATALVAIELPPGDAPRGQAPQPGPRDLCPVCGMLVAKYPAWIASVTYRDGHSHFFDGAKDLFKYLLRLDRYAPGHRREDIAAVRVTEYYGLSRIDARSAHFVIGSDVLGPMGHEFVPLASAADAAEFLRDHKGKRVLRLSDVTAEWVEKVDRGP
jgi:nitrous oxide reductase accessory protein NosL